MPATPDEEEKWRVAVGPRADHYLARWRAMAGRNANVSWNWAACLANLFWFAYRKMWLPMAGLIVAVIVLAVIGASGPGAGRVTLLLNIGLTFVTGAFGNHLYRRHVARLVAETSGLPRAEQLAQLGKRGGVSAPALAISLAVIGLLVLLVMVAAVAEQQNQMNQLNEMNPPGFDPNPPVDGQTDGTMPDKPPIDEQAPPDDYYQEGY
jgi:hypothetical protein